MLLILMVVFAKLGCIKIMHYFCLNWRPYKKQFMAIQPLAKSNFMPVLEGYQEHIKSISQKGKN